MDANDRENSELMSSHNIERCASYYTLPFSIVIALSSDEEFSADDGDSATTQNDQSSDTVLASEEDEPDTRPDVERTPRATRYVLIIHHLSAYSSPNLPAVAVRLMTLMLLAPVVPRPCTSSVYSCSYPCMC